MYGFYDTCCILSKFYIKPQRQTIACHYVYGCILSKFYIKPQLAGEDRKTGGRCILSKFYIKPQPDSTIQPIAGVVSYRNSTSNHNLSPLCTFALELYLIEILHQTTTKANVGDTPECCILSKFYIKPQPEEEPANDYLSCILSKFYIKPQQKQMMRFSASCCILSKFYIKPQQLNWEKEVPVRCILSKFYIKPQPYGQLMHNRGVVSYRNSTSNHNLLLEFVNC